jgi:hypothetical protein
MELPDSFFREDEQGCRGFTEWGFLSTTTNKAIALQYSGAAQGMPQAMVLVVQSSAIDRGAFIQCFSQYPKVPLSRPPPPLSRPPPPLSCPPPPRAPVLPPPHPLHLGC